MISRAGTLAVLVAALAGCRSAEPVGEEAKAKSDFGSTMKELPPEKRAQYLKEHPEEAHRLMSGGRS